MYAGPHAYRASMGAPAACLHCTYHCIWRDTPRFLLSANLSAHHIVILTKVTPANQVPLVALLMGTSGQSACGPQKDWILKELNLQNLEDWPKDEQDQARKLLIR